jgi:hypothetical protein
MLFISRKPIAQVFQEKVFEILKTIRLTGRYEIKSQLEREREKFDEERKCIEADRNQLKALLEEERKKNKTNKIASYTELNRRKRKSGFIYIMTSHKYAIDYIYKVGRSKDCVKRAVSLNTANAVSDQQLYVCFSYDVIDPEIVEAIIHTRLQNQRLDDRREFFVCELSKLQAMITRICAWYNSDENLWEKDVEEMMKMDTDFPGIIPEKLNPLPTNHKRTLHDFFNS